MSHNDDVLQCIQYVILYMLMFIDQLFFIVYTQTNNNNKKKIIIIKELPTQAFKYYSYLKEEKAHLSLKKIILVIYIQYTLHVQYTTI